MDPEAVEVAAGDLTCGEIAAAIDGKLRSGDPARYVSGFSIDSRTLQGGDLFFAISGKRFDGHEFVARALEQNACGAVVSDTRVVPTSRSEQPVPIFIVVSDTVLALQALARHVRRISGTRVVALTGSTGKTTTKEVTAAFLETRYRTFRNKGNLNNHIGLPLSLLELRRRPHVAVVELGMSHPGEIRTLVDIAEPEVRVWTNVGDAHLEFFPSIDAIADAKAEIFDGATVDTMLVANANDTRIMARVPRFAGSVVTFGIDATADVCATDLKDLGLDGMETLVRTPVGPTRLRMPLLGAGNLSNVLAATAVALHFRVPLDAIVEKAATLKAAPHRGEVIRTARGVTIIDDSYNSSPSALRQAFEVLRHASGNRRIAVVGEMLELGVQTVALHEQFGLVAVRTGLDRLLTVGGEPARALGVAATNSGMPAQAVLHVETSEQASLEAVAIVRPGDLVLVKGSRAIKTDLVVERLKAAFD